MLRNSSQECLWLNPELLGVGRDGWACRGPHQHRLNPWEVGAGCFFPVGLNASRWQPLEKSKWGELSIVHIHMQPYESFQGLNPLFQEDRGFLISSSHAAYGLLSLSRPGSQGQVGAPAPFRVGQQPMAPAPVGFPPRCSQQ